MTAHEGYRRLQSTVAGQGFTLDGQSRAGQKAVRDAREEAGFDAKQTTTAGLGQEQKIGWFRLPLYDHYHVLVGGSGLVDQEPYTR